MAEWKLRCVIYDDFRNYLNLDADVRLVFDNFLRQNNIGTVAFLPAMASMKHAKTEHLRGYPISATKFIAKVSLTFTVSIRCKSMFILTISEESFAGLVRCNNTHTIFITSVPCFVKD